MLTVKQHVTVGAGGLVSVQSAELREGESAEVIVSVERDAQLSSEERLAALENLRDVLNLSLQSAVRWEAEVRAERDVWERSPVVG